MTVHQQVDPSDERSADARVSADVQQSSSAGEPELAWQARLPGWLRRALLAERLWFGLVAMALGLAAQRILTPDGRPDPLANITAAIRLYCVAVMVLLVGWTGGYSNGSWLSVSDRLSGRLQWRHTVTFERTRIIVVGVGICANILSVFILSSDWYSFVGTLLWVGSIILIVVGYAGDSSERTLVKGTERGSMSWGQSRRTNAIVLGGILVTALALRLWRLGDLAPGMHGDEGEAGTQALAILDGNHVSPWMRGWFNQSNIYYWTLAIFMRLFGTGLFGLRTFAVFCGVATVLFTYLLAREYFGIRAATIAGFLVAFGSASLLFSRQEFSNVSVPALETGAAYFVVLGLRTRRHLDFVIAGFLSGFAVYYFAGGRLIAPTLLVFFAYLAVFHRAFLRAYWSRALAFCVALACIISPFLAYYAAHPIPTNTYPNDRFIWLHHADLAVIYGSSAWSTILWGQLTRTLSVFLYSTDMSAMSVLDYPVARPLEAVLCVLGIAWAAWRWRDSRFALISVWFWITLIVGGVLTVDAPNLPRILGALPALALAAAAVLDYLCELITSAYSRLGASPRWERIGSGVSGGVVAVVLVTTGIQNKQMYIDHYLNTHTNTILTAQAQYVQKMGTNYYFYGMGAPVIYWMHGDNRFINPKALGQELINASQSLPLIDNGPDANMSAAFLLWSNEASYLHVLQAYYPEGKWETIQLGDAEHITDPLVAFTVAGADIARHRTVRAVYRSIDGTTIVRRESSVGSPHAKPPTGLKYPVRAVWQGALVAPSYDIYRFRIGGPRDAHVSLDGAQMRSGTTRLEVARGAHAFRIEATLANAHDRPDFRWATGRNPFSVIRNQFLWDDHIGRGWRAEVRPLNNLPGLKLPVERRIDGFLGFRGSNLAFPGGAHAVWWSILTVHAGGTFRFELNSQGTSALLIDGKKVVDDSFADLSPHQSEGQVTLTPGKHRLQVRYDLQGGTGYLETWWTPPGGQRQFFITPDLSPDGPGVAAAPSQLSQLPPVPEVGGIPSLAGRNIVLSRRQVALVRFNALAPSSLAIGLEGRIYVGDSQHATITETKSNGQIIRMWSGRGLQPGQFVAIDGMRVGPDGTLYVLDGAASRIQHFSPDGSLLGEISGKGTWCAPKGFDIASDGRVVVADTCRDRVDVYSAAGRLIFSTGGKAVPGQGLFHPSDVVVGGDNFLYVVDARRRVVQLDSLGSIRSTWSLPASTGSGVSHLAISRGVLYVIDKNSAVAIVPFGSRATLSLKGARPRAIAAAPDGRIWVLDGKTKSAQIYKAPGRHG